MYRFTETHGDMFIIIFTNEAAALIPIVLQIMQGDAYHGYYYSTSPFTWSKKSSCGNRDMYTGPACDQCGASAYWWYNAGDSKTMDFDVERT